MATTAATTRMLGSRVILGCSRIGLRAAVGDAAGGRCGNSLSTSPLCHIASPPHARHATESTKSSATQLDGCSSSTSHQAGEGPPPLVTAKRIGNVVASSCGFPKDLRGGRSTVRDAGVYGDDACFIAAYGETCVVGVADGVGGWRKYGIDPSRFSSKLMKYCEEQVERGDFVPEKPGALLDVAFSRMQQEQNKHRPIGSSTACVLTVHDGTLYSANLGDSGFVVVRGGRVIRRSNEQTHYFNAPFQLTLLPEEMMGNRAGSTFIGDGPELADKDEIRVEKGDIVVLATDGLWDNLDEKLLVQQLAQLGENNLQQVCNTVALVARRLAFDEKHDSPFALKAQQHGYFAPGGKPDDITLVMLLIA